MKRIQQIRLHGLILVTMEAPPHVQQYVRSTLLEDPMIAKLMASLPSDDVPADSRYTKALLRAWRTTLKAIVDEGH